MERAKDVHHFMLLFLSTARAYVNNEKKCVEMQPANYEIIGQTRMTNESAVKYLLQVEFQRDNLAEKDQHGSLDRIYAFVTNSDKREITAKDGDKIVYYKDEHGNTCTSADYFKKRLSTVIDDIEDKFVEIPFNENATTQDAMQTVVHMATCIQHDADAFPANSVVLHADMTGGLRHANMMMMAVLRLMEYSHIKIGKILYSNFKGYNNVSRVDDATGIYNTFGLAGGAEEFVQYGSVKAIDAYFNRVKETEKSPELERLLHAMGGFADAIKLCHYGTFYKAIQNLKQAVAAFPTNTMDNTKPSATYDGKRYYNGLAGTLLARIQQDYASLLQNQFDDLTLISWCLEHDYFQQALTLYTERIPEVAYAHGLLHETDAGSKKIAKYDGDNRTRAFLVFSVLCSDREQEQLDELKNKFYKIIQNGLKKGENNVKKAEEDLNELISKGEYVHFSDPQRLKDMFNAVDAIYNKYNWKTKEFKENLVYIARYILAIEKKLNPDDEAVLTSIKEKQQQSKLSHYVKDKLGHLSKSDCLALFMGISSEPYRKFYFLKEDELVQTPLEDEEVRRLINQYGVIKDERNHSNHAKLEVLEENPEILKKTMQGEIDYIQSLIKKYNH